MTEDLDTSAPAVTGGNNIYDAVLSERETSQILSSSFAEEVAEPVPAWTAIRLSSLVMRAADRQKKPLSETLLDEYTSEQLKRPFESYGASWVRFPVALQLWVARPRFRTWPRSQNTRQRYG